MAVPHTQKGISKLFILIILGGIVLVIAGVVFIIIGSKGTPAPKSVTLTIWGVWDESSDLTPIINSYRKTHPYVKINYVKKRTQEYSDALVNGWATDGKPDIYAINNSWINEYRSDFITPLPKSTTVFTYTTKKTLFKTDTSIVSTTSKSITTTDIKRNYIDTVYNDVIFDNKIYGLPFSTNTLVMFYNRELLSQAHLVNPPKTWIEFANILPKITLLDEQNNVVRAGAALGTYDNIPNALDLVTILMLQNGTIMTNGSNITFDAFTSGENGYAPGAQALRFYTDFSNPNKTVYTWNKDMPNALDYFAEGKLAFFFGYKYQEADIKAKSRGIDYAIAPLPQVNLENEINFANYNVYTVSKKTKDSSVAWNFLQFASDKKLMASYVKATSQTSALRSILSEQLSDPDLGILAQQALTATSWYHGRGPQQAAEAFSNMITTVSGNQSAIQNALTTAAQQIEQSY
ncbi:MAG: extracellular solute-binding protein [Patescibacteria group bacterium]|jgi:ABC-type glycerol-3-phosphate transport system substrate-binding protein